MPTIRRPPARLAIAVVASAAAALTACSSSGGGTPTAGSTPPAVASTPPSSPSSSPPASAPPPGSSSHPSGDNLSGRWSGEYGGAFQGTFNLRWTQSGASLSGTITLSDPGETLTLNGTVHGSAITFGTVGSAAITYTGTVSGSSMSGRYRVAGASGGNWDAHHSA